MTTDKDGWRQFLELCTKAGSPQKLEELLDLFFTIEEKETAASRYMIIKALIEGKLTQREIASKHEVSIAQITRGSNALKIISKGLKGFLQKHL